MSRTHLFAIVVLLGAAAVAGLLAVTRTTTAAATQPSNTEIAARSRSLDALEASLRRSLAEQPPVAARASGASTPRTVVAPAAAATAELEGHDDHGGDDDHGDEHDDEDRADD